MVARSLSAFVAVGFLFGSVACTRGTPDPRVVVVAKVNGEPVYLQDFLGHYAQLKSEQDEVSLKNPKLVEEMKVRALNEGIVLKLLRQEASRRQLRVAREEVEARLTNWKDSYPPGAFEEMLRKQAINEDFLRRRIEDQLLVDKLVEKNFAQEALVSDEEMKQHFATHDAEFTKPERVHAFQIVVPSPEEAQKVRQEIVANQLTFESAARKYSLSPDAANGGDLGFFARNEKIAAFNDAFQLPLGQVSKPIQSRYGYHLLKVVEKQPARKLTFMEAKTDVAKTMRRFKEMKVYKEWVTKLLKDGEFYRNETALANVP